MTDPAPNAAKAPIISTEPDDALVERVRAGEEWAYEALMRRYNQRLYRVARSITRNPAEAEDVVQEAYVRAFSKLDSLREGSGFGGWVTRIAANEALDRLRKSGRQASLDALTDPAEDGGGVTLDGMVSSDPDPERAAASVELRPLLEDAIEKLPDPFRAVFILRAVEQMTVAETATMLDIPEATVKTRFHRARNILKEIFAEQVAAGWPSTYPFAGARCDRTVARVYRRLGLSR